MLAHDIIDNRKEKLVDRILAAKRKNPTADVSALACLAEAVRRWKREIAAQPRKMFANTLTVAVATGGDQQVYALYPPSSRVAGLRRAGGLTPEEIKIVEGSAK